MNRAHASKLLRDELNKHGLNNWGVRLNSDINSPYLGICLQRDKCIVLNAHHVDIHPDLEVICTIKHEVAHALTPGHGHDQVWSDKAKEIGCDNTLPCSHLNLPDYVIDGIRSNAEVEVTVEEEHHVIRKPVYKVTRLQDKCPDCGQIAKEKFHIETIDPKSGDTIRLITLECFHIIKKVLPKATPFENMVSNDWSDPIKNCKHEWVKNQCSKCNEFKLFNFQLIGAKAAEQGLALGKGFGIFDDMGLGKTVQALAVIKYHPELTPTLYVAKSAIKFNWFKQIIRWLGPNYLAQIISTSKDSILPGLKSYIISYDLLRRFPSDKLDKIGIKCVVLDECQQIKNADSTRTQEVRKLVKNPDVKVIPLSGTPWKNRGDEFFPVLNLLSPIKFYSQQAYLDRWVSFYYDGPKRKQGGINRPAQFREYINDIVIRREYNEVMDEFPDINRMKLPIQLDDLSQSTYDDSVSEFVAWYNQAVIDGTEDQLSGIEILAKLARMRHICGLAKIPATLGFIEEFLDDCERKLVIFVHHKDVGEILFNECNRLYKDRIQIMKLNAEQSDLERFNTQERFNNSKRAILIASTLASGEGIDLQTCSDCVMHERQWNPQNEEQAAPGRFRRIGQKSSVINITIPEGEGTIDEYLDNIVNIKRVQFHEVMNKSEMVSYNESDMGKQLAEVIVKKHKEKNKGNVSNKTKISIMAGMR